MAIYVIEHHPLMREALVMALRRIRPEAEIVELAQLPGLSKAIAANGEPELFCLDLRLPDVGVSGIELLKDRYPRVPLAVVSALPAAEIEDACREAGADVYIEKSTPSAEVVATLRAVLTPETIPSELDGDNKPKPDTRLSKRQKQLIVMLDGGMSNREIAESLGISEHTVKVHLWRLFRRLGVNSRTQTLHYVRKHGLLSL
ncbi:MAG: response regulator transcription factor [Burkholderiaceae bacterium]|nr:response regulator transcription factor [Burkholderiaceae bacterium]